MNINAPQERLENHRKGRIFTEVLYLNWLLQTYFTGAIMPVLN